MTLNVNAVCAVGVPSLSLDLPFDEVISNTGGASYTPRNADYNHHYYGPSPPKGTICAETLGELCHTPVMKHEKPRPYTN